MPIFDTYSYDTNEYQKQVKKELKLFKNSEMGKCLLNFQKNIVLAAGWGLIYHHDTSPEYGYYRATKLIEDFNRVYHWNLNSSFYQSVFNKKYLHQQLLC